MMLKNYGIKFYAKQKDFCPRLEFADFVSKRKFDEL